MRLFSLLLVSVCFVFGIYSLVSDDLEPLTDEMINKINSMDLKWKAGRNFDGHNFEDIKYLLSTFNESYKDFDRKTYNNENLPLNFDAREKWPNCPSIGKLYKQDSCTPAWIYASVGQIADRICITTGIQIDVETTVKQMIKYYGNCEYNSANFCQAFRYWVKYGIFAVKPDEIEKCQMPFSEQSLSKDVILDYFKLNPVTPKVYDDKMHEVLLNGPMTIQLDVYSDFLNYKSGIYKRASKRKIGTHVIKIIGWGVEEDVKYWLVPNTWGVEWGDKGFFKIRRSTSELGDNIHSVAVSISNDQIANSYNLDQLFYSQTG